MAFGMTDDEEEEACFRRMSAVLDELWMLRRARLAAGAPFRVDTLSTSLADPRSAHVEMILSHARIVIQSDADRAAFILVARACLAQGVLDEAAAARLVKESATR